MVGYEPQISDAGCNRSTRRNTTTALIEILVVSAILCILFVCFRIILNYFNTKDKTERTSSVSGRIWTSVVKLSTTWATTSSLTVCCFFGDKVKEYIRSPKPFFLLSNPRVFLLAVLKHVCLFDGEHVTFFSPLRSTSLPMSAGSNFSLSSLS